MKGRKNPVKKNMDEYQKPRTFRDRKKESKKYPQTDEAPHPRHDPYCRPNRGCIRYDLDEEADDE